MRWNFCYILLIATLILIHVLDADAQRGLISGRGVRLGIGRFYNRVSAIRKLVL
jgi:hypothetical protein